MGKVVKLDFGDREPNQLEAWADYRTAWQDLDKRGVNFLPKVVAMGRLVTANVWLARFSQRNEIPPEELSLRRDALAAEIIYRAGARLSIPELHRVRVAQRLISDGPGKV